jgi:DNA (cytosine-5)-methyltransferase 1
VTAYTDILDLAWAQHLKPPADDAPTVVSTFAGCGGSSLGYSMAGYRELLTVEWDDHAAECLRRNFPDVRCYHGDIAEVDPDMLGIPTGSLDVLDGSPPCQGFSTSGKRNLDDPRNQLFREFVRLLDAWQPRVFVMENVKGLIQGTMKSIFVQIMDALRTAGPGYRVSCRLILAEYVGVPQARRRVVFIGVRDDLGMDPVHPLPSGPVLTARDAIADLIDDPGIVADINGPKILHKQQQLLASVLPGERGADVMMRNGKNNTYFNIARLDWDRPSRTVLKEVRIGMHLGGMMHPSRHRFLGTHELARLQSFPDQYDWGDVTGDELKDYTRIVNRIGNSVPPLMMRAIASTIADRLLRPVSV